MTSCEAPHRVCKGDLTAVGALAAELADAFAGYVWTDWVFPADRRRERLRAAFEVFLGVAVGGMGEVWTTADGHSVASWFAPGPPTLGDIGQAALEETSRRLLGDNADRVEMADRAIAALRPAQPFWYLSTLGTHPRHRNRGLASCVLAPVLRRCDDERVPAVVETCGLDNVRRYLRLGFTVVAEVDPPGAAPHVWMMSRPPRRRTLIADTERAGE